VVVVNRRGPRLPRSLTGLPTAFKAGTGRAYLFINCREGDPVLTITVSTDVNERREFTARGRDEVVALLDWLRGKVPP
jgi:hypothetical protein